MLCFNWFKNRANETRICRTNEYDNKPIGIILCKSKKEIAMEYALGGLENNVFASTYTYYIPKKEVLINEVEKVLGGIKWS